MSDLAIVVPTLGRPHLLARVLDRLDRQTTHAFEVVVVADAAETALPALDAAAAHRPYPVRRLQAARRGASAARNLGWRSTAAPLVLFLDDDVLPEPGLVAAHRAWHARHPGEEVGVLGHVRWADELRVTPFMRWLEHGVQFDFPGIVGTDAGWGRFYTANASVKRALVARAGGFEEEALPFGYEDLDLALRMHEHGFRLLYAREAVAEHVHPMDVAFWQRRVARIAVSERAFCARHPGFAPYFHAMFASAPGPGPTRGIARRLAWAVPRGLPVLGERVWRSADLDFRAALAPHFLAAWDQGPK